MMKYKLSILLVGLLLLSSCDGFLDRQPLSKISTETFWRNESDVKKALAGVYHTLVPGVWSVGFGGLRTQIDGLSDDAFTAVTWPGSMNIPQSGSITPASGGIVRSYYTFPYEGIAVCNNFIRNIERVPNMSQEIKNKYLAEVRFLRAWHYQTLAQMYGGVVIVPPNINVKEPNLPRSSKEETVNYILEDLNFAINHLSAEPYSGRVVKGSARGLKLRVLLYNERWEEAAKVGQKIIDGGVFSLSDDWAGMFDGTAQQGNSEIMFSIVYQAPNMRHEYDRMYGLWGSCAPVMDLVNAFGMKNGESTQQSALYDPEHPFKNRDPRLEMTVVHVGEQKPYTDRQLEEGQYPTDMLWEKGLYLNQPIPTGASNNDQDIILIRYADVLLMYAEAMNEAYGPSQPIYEAVNTVRTRVGMPPITQGLNKEELRMTIRHERRVELAGEGLRFFDIKRWRIAHKVIPELLVPGSITEQTPQGIHRVFTEKMYLWPIPQSEVDQNPLLEQNPGYL